MSSIHWILTSCDGQFDDMKTIFQCICIDCIHSIWGILKMGDSQNHRFEYD